MKQLSYHLTAKSANRKTGCMPVSTSPAQTCPASCPFKGNGCYAEGGPLKMHWDKVSAGQRGTDWSNFLGSIAKLPNGTTWRHNQAGDLCGSANTIDHSALKELVAANKGKNGYTYTHYTMNDESNRKAVREANAQGFTINLSAESLTQADELLDLDIGPVALTMTSAAQSTVTPKGRKVVVCPAQTNEAITCAQCRLCAKSNRKLIVCFRAHGFKRSFVDKNLNKIIE